MLAISIIFSHYRFNFVSVLKHLTSIHCHCINIPFLHKCNTVINSSTRNALDYWREAKTEKILCPKKAFCFLFLANRAPQNVLRRFCLYMYETNANQYKHFILINLKIENAVFKSYCFFVLLI